MSTDGTGSRNREENLRLHDKVLLSSVKPQLNSKASGSYKVHTGPRLGETSPGGDAAVGTERSTGDHSHPDMQALLQKPDCRCILLTFWNQHQSQNFKWQHLLFIKPYPLVL